MDRRKREDIVAGCIGLEGSHFRCESPELLPPRAVVRPCRRGLLHSGALEWQGCMDVDAVTVPKVAGAV